MIVRRDHQKDPTLTQYKARVLEKILLARRVIIPARLAPFLNSYEPTHDFLNT